MNLLKKLTLALAPLLGLAGVARAADLPLEKRTFTDGKGKTLPYRLLKPEDYDPKKAYPLVLFLHGAGERGTDNDKQLVHGVPDFVKNRKEYPCLLIAPQCPANVKWVDVDWGADSHKQPAEMTEPMRLTLELIPALQKEFTIDTKRIYATGLSMGGYGVWDIVVRKPDLFAAAVPICGGGDEATAKQIAKLPVWAFHGAKDGAVKVSRSRNMIDALKKTGGEPKYTEYPNEGHGSWVPAYRDAEMFKWLFAQKRE
ncbi:MAG: prolyl oligopeptidase family serine peptidase [Gemmataceae bacterium]|nr:prolyl oligopeptidase family serine peptidase [Gemmataceae bacterium]